MACAVIEQAFRDACLYLKNKDKKMLPQAIKKEMRTFKDGYDFIATTRLSRWVEAWDLNIAPDSIQRALKQKTQGEI